MQGEQEQPPKLHHQENLDEKEKHTDHRSDTSKDVHLKPLDKPLTAESDVRHGGSFDKKRLRCDRFSQRKRVKQEIFSEFDSCKTLRADPSSFSTHTHLSSCTVPVQNISRLSVPCPNSSRSIVNSVPAGLISYPAPGLFPYQTASWEGFWDISKKNNALCRQTVLKDYAASSSEAQRQKEALRGCFTPPHYFPLAVRQQETGYLRGRELLRSQHENCHLLIHPGFLATSCPGPWLSRVSLTKHQRSLFP